VKESNVHISNLACALAFICNCLVFPDPLKRDPVSAELPPRERKRKWGGSGSTSDTPQINISTESLKVKGHAEVLGDQKKRTVGHLETSGKIRSN